MTAQPTVSGRCSLLLLAGALLAGLWASDGVEALMQPWCSVIDTALVGWNISSSRTATHKLCHLACLDTPGCQSANYWYRKKVCELNSVSHLNVSGRPLVEKAGSVYTFTQQETGCNLQSTAASCHDNEPKAPCSDNMRDREWRLVFKGVAGTGAKLHDMWTRVDWTSSYEASGHRRDNCLYQAWHNGLLNVRRVKLSLYEGAIVRAELIFDGAGSDIGSWFTQTRLISSPWDDLKSVQFGGDGQYFSIDGHVEEDRRFFINNHYGGCEGDKGWLVVTESDSLNYCGWEGQTEAHPYPMILYSTTNHKVLWNDVLSNGGGPVGRADSLTIHIDAE
ncbi:uncharacterized protein LOC119736970 [Patiria miniata]|uniref:Apple domain-containing protein n=1 Tax=Patiria miniata TaxID=46514 RepID=A0A914ATX7_PATMI|nr:uncharacterized protein LOC119736970 [Patiria miniata]